MLHSNSISPEVRKAVIQQLKKGGYKLPALQSLTSNPTATCHVLYAATCDQTGDILEVAICVFVNVFPVTDCALIVRNEERFLGEC